MTLERRRWEKLDPFIGRWRLEASFGPGGSSEDAAAFCVFERELGGEFVVGRSHAPDPAPDSLTIIRFDPTSETYSQHYFDSRGVVRVYAMTLADGVWTLLRDAPDFSPLEFRNVSPVGSATTAVPSWGGGRRRRTGPPGSTTST